MKYLVLLMLLFISLKSFSGVMIEPYANYAMGSGDLDITFNTGRKNDLSYAGLNVGTRLGYLMGMFGFGLDYSYYPETEFESEAKDTWTWNSTQVGKLKFGVERNATGIYLGYFGPALKIWGGYYFLSSMTVVSSSKSLDAFRKDDKLEGTGFQLGIGYFPIHWFAINLEYRSFEYKDDGQYTNSTQGGSGSYDISSTEILLGVSFFFDTSGERK